MTDCEKCREMISCLLDGELDEKERSFVRGHIAGCPECRRVYEAFLAVSAQLREEEPLPDGLHEKIMSGIKAKPKKKTGVVWIKYLSAAACLAVVIFAGVKSGLLAPAENKADANEMYAAETMPLLYGSFAGQADDGSGNEKTADARDQSAKTSVALGEEDSERLLELIKPTDGAKEYEPTAEADYAITLDGADNAGVVFIYIDGGRVYADCGEGALSASCTADEIRDLLDARAGK